MNLAAPVPVTAPEDASVHRESWSRLRWGCYVLLAFAAHVGLIFIFGSRKPVTPRAVVNAPRFQLASRHNEMLALADPTLFALPHARGFAAAAWEQLPRIEFVPFRWTEPPQVLALPSAHLGSAFIHFAETNVVPPPVLETLPPPQPSFGTTSGRLTSLRQYSRLMRGGDLAQRDWLTPPAPLPSWPANDLLTNSVVRVVVDAEGRVFPRCCCRRAAGRSRRISRHWTWRGRHASRPCRKTTPARRWVFSFSNGTPRRCLKPTRPPPNPDVRRRPHLCLRGDPARRPLPADNLFRDAPTPVRPAAIEDRIFRCDRCGQVYTDDPDVDRSRCSQCGKLNEPIVF